MLYSWKWSLRRFSRAFSCFSSLYFRAYKIREGGKLITKWSISLLLLFCPLITFNFAPLKCCGCQKLGEEELLCALQNLWIETLKDWRRRREGRRNFATQSSIRFSSFRIIIFSSCYYCSLDQKRVCDSGREACNK